MFKSVNKTNKKLHFIPNKLSNIRKNEWHVYYLFQKTISIYSSITLRREQSRDTGRKK